jgi:transcriptional regulator with XRE-family HTH domain
MQTEAITLDKTQCHLISKNLGYLITINNLTESKVAQDLNIPVMTVRRLVSGETTDPRISTLKILANYFNTTIDHLIGEEMLIQHSVTTPSKPFFVPLLNWETVKQLKDIDFNKWVSWIPLSVRKNEPISNDAFALESRPSMYPPFQTGTIFVLDPKLKPADGDLVLVKLLGDNEMTLRELKIDPPDWQLYSINRNASPLSYSKEHHCIIAVVYLTLFYNRNTKPA